MKSGCKKRTIKREDVITKGVASNKKSTSKTYNLKGRNNNNEYEPINRSLINEIEDNESSYIIHNQSKNSSYVP